MKMKHDMRSAFDNWVLTLFCDATMHQFPTYTAYTIGPQQQRTNFVNHSITFLLWFSGALQTSEGSRDFQQYSYPGCYLAVKVFYAVFLQKQRDCTIFVARGNVEHENVVTFKSTHPAEESNAVHYSFVLLLVYLSFNNVQMKKTRHTLWHSTIHTTICV